jgi:hypothetical protein
MLARTADDQEMVDALVTQFVTGDISQTVFQVSLHKFIDIDDIKYLTTLNITAHKNSLNYKRGMFR